MLKLKLQYFDHLMRRTDSLEKTLMLGKIEVKRRKGQRRMRWLDGITSMMPSNHLILCRPLLLLPSTFLASRSFPVSLFFTSGGQSIGVSASASVIPMNIQD